ncbi:MAG: COR domain-containing protein [Pseudomonadota bacterium]
MHARACWALQLWDFGGQDIYHSTHTLFLKSRGLFLIAWTPEMERADTHEYEGQTFRNHPLPYWLSQVGEFAGYDAPVVLVQAPADKLGDEEDLSPAAKKKLNAFKTGLAISYSAKRPRNHERLIDAITEGYEALDKPLIGKVRAAVKRELEDRRMKRSQKTMAMSDFYDLCVEEVGITDPDLFLDFLHHCGTVFYRKGLFKNEIIIDQGWDIDAIYSVFDCDSDTYRRIVGGRGRFTPLDLGLLLWNDHFSEEEQAVFLTMMQSCGICFVHKPVSEGVESEYIAPDLLPEALPSSDMRERPDDPERLERQYTSLPSALIRNIICALGGKAGQQGDYWRTGLRVHESRFRSWGVVYTDPGPGGGGRVVISCYGGDAPGLLKELFAIVDSEEARLGLTLKTDASDCPEFCALEP